MLATTKFTYKSKNQKIQILRHSFAKHLLEEAVDIRFIQELLRHNNIKTTERYAYVANIVQTIAQSPLDAIEMNSDDEKPP